MTRLVAIAVVCLTVASASPHAYLKLGASVNGRVIDATWHQQPIGYFISMRDGTGTTAEDLRGAVERATTTWAAVSAAHVRFSFQGMTTAPAEGTDGRNTIGFLHRPDLDRVLGSTSFMIDSVTGSIFEADVFLNTSFAFSVAAGGQEGRVDLESIVLHELGHLLGLGHSAIGETERTATGTRRVLGHGAVMFPISLSVGTVADRALQADDVAGLSDLYPTALAELETGGIVGRITKNGRGVLGAHVIAFNPETGVLIGGFTLSDSGEFVIARLPPGLYILRVEPLDDAEPDSFFPNIVDTDFRVTYAPRMVVAPKGGSSLPIEISVLPK
ncbi:MAG TPA: carboxypeptidase-like regulatory domain-containing protein [Vicinamibacterales bacterium]|nr:carboxypeptidase-like regulatory domain-containing protein [Vicinamibacterales bacterium]